MLKSKKIIIFLLVILIFLIISGFLILKSKSLSFSVGEKLKVGATIFPLYDIIKNIGGDKIVAVLILPSGASPHTFEVTPEQIKNLIGAKAIFQIGHQIDNWIKNVSQAIPQAQIITVDKNINFLARDGEIDPHYWLSLKNGEIIAQNILANLISLDPSNKDYYQNNFVHYVQKLEALDQAIKNDLSSLKSRYLLTLHDAFYYFARDYSLKVVGSFEPGGKEIKPNELIDLEKKIKEYKIGVVFSEPQLSQSLILPFFQDLKLKIFVLDPLGGAEGRDTYLNLLKYDAQTIKEALNL